MIEQTYSEFTGANKDRATGCVPASTYSRPGTYKPVLGAASFKKDHSRTSEKAKAALSTSGRAGQTSFCFMEKQKRAGRCSERQEQPAVDIQLEVRERSQRQRWLLQELHRLLLLV